MMLPRLVWVALGVTGADPELPAALRADVPSLVSQFIPGLKLLWPAPKFGVVEFADPRLSDLQLVASGLLADQLVRLAAD